MNKIMIFFLFLNGILISAQNFRASITADFAISSEQTTYQFGPSLMLEYDFDKIPIVIRTDANFSIAEIKGVEYFSSAPYNHSEYGISVLYKPIDWPIEPYLGVSALYNWNSVRQVGNWSYYSGNNHGYLIKMHDNISFGFIAGLVLSANTPVNVILELMQIINQPKYDIAINDVPEARRFNFNSVIIRAGVRFKL